MKFSTHFLLLSTIIPIALPLNSYSRVPVESYPSHHSSQLERRVSQKKAANMSKKSVNSLNISTQPQVSAEIKANEQTVFDRNAILKGIDRKIIANRIASWKLQTMPYEELVKLQHTLIVLVPFFQNNVSLLNFHQTKSRSNVTVQDAKNCLIHLLDSTVKKNEVRNKIQIDIENQFGKSTGFITFHDDMLGYKVANKVKINPEVLKNIKILKEIKDILAKEPISTLQNENLETTKAKNVLEILNVRLRFLEDAVNETVRKRYDPARSVDPNNNEKGTSKKQNYNYYDMDSEKITKAKERLTKREKRAEIMAEYKELKEQKIQLERKKEKIKSQKNIKLIDKQIETITDRITELREEMETNKSKPLVNPSSTKQKAQKH